MGYKKTALAYAARRGHLVIVCYLVEGSVLVNATDVGGNTPVMLAAQGVHKDVIEYILEHCASVDVTDRLGYTPLIWAAEKRHLEIVKYLVKCNVPVSCDRYRVVVKQNVCS